MPFTVIQVALLSQRARACFVSVSS